MKIALCGPVDTRLLRPWLPPDVAVHNDGGTPVGELASALLTHDPDAEVLCVGLSTSISTAYAFRSQRLSLIIMPARKSHRARDGFKYERENISGALMEERPDVVHAQWTYEYALASLATKLPTLITVHDWAPKILRFKPSPYRLVLLGMNVKAISSAPFLAAPSPYIHALVRRYHGRVPVLLPNLIADNYLLQGRRLRSADGNEILAANNGFSQFKNVHTLLVAFQMVRLVLPNAHLTLVGSDHEPGGPADRWASENGLLEGVTFRGPVNRSELRDCLDQADLFVHPSREESFGYVLLEAMARGLPVVAGVSSGAVAWLLRGGEAGLLVDVNAADDVAAAVTRALNDRDVWQTLSDAGVDRAQAFTASSLAPSFSRSYEKVLQLS